MNKNIITHIDDASLKNMMESVIDEMNLVELSILEYEEFFHALMHFNPQVFIVEINEITNPYMKIVQIMRKSILTRAVPILVLTQSQDPELIKILSNLDVQGILYAPIYASILKFNIVNILKTEKSKETLQNVQDIQTVQTVMISSLATLAEYRDPETGEHIKRTQNYVKALATTLRKQGYFVDELTDDNIELIYMSVPLHDIGKVGIRDVILLKPGRLTKDEFEIMKTHTTVGYETLASVGSKLKNNAFLEYAADVAYTHHEKYDGTGYPRQLKGDDIPLIGRLMAVADVYDALITKRIYKEAMSHEDAMEIIKSGSGSHFDPRIVAATMLLENTFQNIAQTYRDSHTLDSQTSQLSQLVQDKMLKSVLVVEDSRIVRTITKNQMIAIGLDVDEAADGAIGLSMIKSHSYDMVLLDIEMPNMNGYEMASEVMHLKDPPIMIAMTAADFNITLSELKKFGIYNLLLKPIDFNRLATLYYEATQNHV